MSGIASREAADNLYKLVMQRRAKQEMLRLAPNVIRLWDGDYNLRGVVAGERRGDYEFIENDVGTGYIQLPLDHYLAKWVMEYKGRKKRNVHITFDKPGSGSRWAGRMSHYTVRKEKSGDRYLEVFFRHDMAELEHILVWSNPWLLPELQVPKMWVIFGPAKYCLLMTLFVNILRLETSPWNLPDDPLDPSEWWPLSFNPSNWRNIVKPFSFFSDASMTTVVFSRFESFLTMAKRTLDEAQLTLVCRRYFPDEDQHPFEGMQGLFGIDLVEDMMQKIPLRHGCLVWDIQDNSGHSTETSFGGSLLTGLVRAVANIASDGTVEGVDVYTNDPVFPGEYYNRTFMGTSAAAPWVIFEEGPLTGIESSEFSYYEATDTSVIAGGSSPSYVNSGISALVNIGGDALTSFINSTLAVLGAVGGAIDLPPLGGLLDSLAKPVYENALFAWQQTNTLRASELTLPLAGLEGTGSSLGDFHYYEARADEGEAHSVGSHLATRRKIHETRARTEHTLTVADAAPYRIGERGYGDLWLGNRAGISVLGFPTPETIFVERVQRLKYAWDQDGPKGWEIAFGYKKSKDPVLNLFDQVKKVAEATNGLGLT